MTNLETLKELYRTFREKDYDTFQTLCDPELQWIQNRGFPNGGTHHGAQEVIDNVFKRFSNDWDSFGYEIEQYLESGEAITVVGRYVGKHRATGKSFESPAIHLYEFRAGKVLRLRQFTDTKVIWDAMA